MKRKVFSFQYNYRLRRIGRLGGVSTSGGRYAAHDKYEVSKHIRDTVKKRGDEELKIIFIKEVK